MNVFFAIINIGFLSFIAYRIWSGDKSPLKNIFWPAIGFKLGAGICLGLLYRHYYNGGDTFIYFEEGTKLTALARSDVFLYVRFLWSGDESFDGWNNLVSLQPRALFMIKVVSLVNLVSHDNYWISSLYFSFISFSAAWFLVKTIVRFEASLRNAAVIAFLFFPSVVFWSSGLMKESLAIASLLFLMAIFLKAWMVQGLRWWEWVLIPVNLWLLWRLKYYYLAVFVPLASASLVVRILFFRGRLKTAPLVARMVVWCVLLLVPMIVIASLRPNFHPDRFLHVVVSNYQEFHALSDSEDLIYYHQLEPTVGSMLINTPWALFSGLYRPFLWEAGTPLKLLIALENFVLIVLSAAALLNVVKMMRSLNRLLLVSTILYVVVLCVFLALSTPNFGTLARYRVGFLPFFVLLISIENPLLKGLKGLPQRSGSHLVP
jgi:hypothetical protein